MMKDPNKYNVRAVERALQIMDCFDDGHPEMGISEIAHVVGLHKATAYRIVTTLVNYGYLEWMPDNQKYKLGLELSNLGFKVIRQMDLWKEALPHMRKLVQEWDEACDLSVYNQGRAFYIEVLHGSHALTIAATAGQRLPVHCTASGKLFLAYLPPEELNVILDQPLTAYTENTITSPEMLRNQLEIFHKQGYSIDNEEYELGICALAVPIFNHRGIVIAAIGGASPTSRMTHERITKIVAAYKDAGQAISRRMGYDQ